MWHTARLLANAMGNFMIILQDRYYSPHFTDEKMGGSYLLRRVEKLASFG